MRLMGESNLAWAGRWWMPNCWCIARNQLLNSFYQLVPVTKCSDPYLLQVLMTHFGENVHGYLFPVKHLPQLLQTKGGEEGPNAHVEARLACHHLCLREVHAAIARVGSWEGSACASGNDSGRRCSTYTGATWHNYCWGALLAQSVLPQTDWSGRNCRWRQSFCCRWQNSGGRHSVLQQALHIVSAGKVQRCLALLVFEGRIGAMG